MNGIYVNIMAVFIWFTSDLHLGHRAVINFQDRPFGTVEEMNEALIKNWNFLVGR